MHRLSRLTQGLAGCVAALLLTSLTTPASAAEPPRPRFYEAPAKLPAANGAVIRSEPMTYKLDPHQANTVVMDSWRVLYKSSDRRGKPIAVSGTIMVPKTPWLGVGRRPVIGYAAGTQGMADRCAPSRQFSEGLEYEGLFITGLLQRGYAIAMTDYEGLGTAGVHTYMDRVSQGHAVLDAVRAAQSLPGSGLSKRNPVGLQGYSQGGGAAASAAELASSYAPELTVKGASVGAVPADLPSVAQKMDGGAFAELLLFATAGLTTSYGVDNRELMNERGAAKLAEVQSHCVIDLHQNAYLRTADLTTSGKPLAQQMETEPWRTIAAEQRIGNQAPKFPVLVTHSAQDDVIPYEQGRAMARSWCQKSARVRFSTNYTPGHVGGMLSTSVEMYSFFEARFAGLPPVSTCGQF